MMIETITAALILGAWAYVYRILTDPGEAFDFMPEVINQFASFGHYGARDAWEPNCLQRAIRKWGYECAKCHAGFVGLWAYPLYFYLDYTLEKHFAFLVLSILTAHLLSKLE